MLLLRFARLGPALFFSYQRFPSSLGFFYSVCEDI